MSRYSKLKQYRHIAEPSQNSITTEFLHTLSHSDFFTVLYKLIYQLFWQSNNIMICSIMM